MGSADSELVQKAEAILARAKAFNGDQSDRHALMQQVDRLYHELEDPMDAMLRQWLFMNTAAALNVMVELGALEKMPKGGSITAKDLSALVNVEPEVIIRIMRILTGTGIVALTAEDTYAHTPKSMAYLDGAALDFFNLCINMSYCFSRFAEYFKTKTPEDMRDLRQTPYSFAYGNGGQTFYEILTADPKRLNMFNKAMMQQEAHLPTLGMFSFTSLEKEVTAEPDRVFVVDIAGGRGHSLAQIGRETSNAFGTGAKMILQERPEVLATIPPEEIPGIETMIYNFYEEQPVKNAHIYYYRRILHNYQDHICVEILKVVAAAMGPTSRLLIADVVIPTSVEVGEDIGAYWMDMVMLAIGGKERTVQEFTTLFEAAGLELVKVWPFNVGSQAVVEARLKR